MSETENKLQCPNCGSTEVVSIDEDDAILQCRQCGYTGSDMEFTINNKQDEKE